MKRNNNAGVQRGVQLQSELEQSRAESARTELQVQIDTSRDGGGAAPRDGPRAGDARRHRAHPAAPRRRARARRARDRAALAPRLLVRVTSPLLPTTRELAVPTLRQQSLERFETTCGKKYNADYKSIRECYLFLAPLD